MRRSRSPASSCCTASGRDSSDWDVWAFKAELHLQSGMRCFRPEVCTAKQQGVLARAGYLHQNPEEVRHGFDRRRPGARRNMKPGPQTSELVAKGHQRTAVQYAEGVQVTFVSLHFTDDLVLVGRGDADAEM